ncbi:MAG TPA: TonB-dependent receptor [Candidatus Sulfotelmatobacter sp.]|nr:TonB-dependent receptor [Candidatus Sulfotelmatobacter sp.]
MKRSLWTAVAVFTLLCSLWAPSAFGQAVYGSVLGTVTDPSGAAVNGAKVTVTSQTRNTSTETTTNESGNYSVTHLIPDVYTVRVEGTGFKSLEFKSIQVSADSGSRVDGQFQVGGASETVEVTSEAPQLKTDRADVSVEFTGKQLQELPLYNRNFQSLELLTPGTQILTGWGHAATENPQGSKQIFVNGQHFSGTGYELDGTDNQDPILGIIIVNPSLDTVEETKIATQNYDAEFGKAVAGIMTAHTRSGTNEFHGSGYFYDLDPVDPATNPFTGKASPNNWKQFGGSVGGPIIKNKLFFFANYEATRRKSGVSLQTTVPTALFRSTCLNPSSAVCDLSEYLAGGFGGGGQVYNPTGPEGGRTEYNAPIGSCTGNCIPQADLQAVDANFTGSGLTTSESILALLPAPNATGDHNGTNNNYTANGSGSFNDYQYVGRVDYTMSQRMQIFGRYTHAHFLLSGKPVFGDAIGGPGLGYLGLAGQSLINNYSVAAGFNYTLSNSLLTDFRFGYFRYNPHSTKYDQGNSTAASSLGLPGLNTTDVTTNGLPAFFFDGLNMQFGEDLNIGRCNCPLIEKEQGYQFANNWTKLVGNHQFKFGADLRHATNLRVPSDANRTGEMHFQHDTTGDGLGSGGLDIATFLFSAVSNFNRYVGSPTETSAMETQNRYFFYAQDTWRATHKLTVNYGLRWEFYTPEYVNGKGNGGFAVLPEGVIRVAGYGGISNNGNTKNNYGLFAPRLGIAYEINPKTVVRMGYGRSFDIGVFGSLFGHTVTQNLPVLANQQLTSPTGDNRTTAYNFTQGPAAPQTAFPVIPSNGILPLYGVCTEAVAQTPGAICTGNVSPHIRPDKLVAPTVDAWNVTVQRQVTDKLSVEAAYVANHGSHVFKGTGPSYNPNQPTVVGYPTIPYDQRAPYYNAFSTPYTYADGFTTNVICCDGSQGFGYNGDDGTNSFRALELTVNHRTGGGLTLSGSYTYSRAYDNDGSYQPDLRVGYGRQDYNRDSVLIMTAIYELPFGKGKRFMGNISRPADLLLGGWQWNATFTIGSGIPFTPSYSNCGQDRDTGPCRPSRDGSFHMGAGSFNNQTRQVVYFTPVVDPATADGTLGPGDCVGGWCRPAIATFGNIQRNSYTGPGEFRSDMSLFKNFSITERVKAQFQAEFFNVFNHPVYDLPSGCIDCAGNGLITNIEPDSSMREMQLGFRVTF